MRKRRQTMGATAIICAGAVVLVAAFFTPRPGQAQTQIAEAEPQTGLRGVWYSGYDVVKGEHYWFSGATVALNGDLSRNGFFVRTYGSLVDYDLDPGDGRGYQADLMLGYRASRGWLDGGVYVGVDYQDYRLDPDDRRVEVRGTEWGFKVAADLETLREESPFYFALEGEYSTAFQMYWARARVGATLNGITFGPEVVALGDLSFDAQRVGGFVIFDLKLLPQTAPLGLTLHAGHQFVSGDNGAPVASVRGAEGTYGGITLTVFF